VNLTTQCLNNIKMLKLYSWANAFENMIGEKRKAEMGVLWTRFKYGMTNTTSLYFFPSILTAVVFSVYIGTGNTLDLSVAYTVTTILNMVKVRLTFDFAATPPVAASVHRTGGGVHGVHETYPGLPPVR